MALGFYAENRRVANGKAKRVLGWRPAYPTYREGLRSCFSAGGGVVRARRAITSPAIANIAPKMVSAFHRYPSNIVDSIMATITVTIPL